MSALARPIDVPGFRGDTLPCVLHADAGQSSVAVVFPGGAQHGNRLGGTPARPDLHYTRAVLRAEGIAVFEVWWDAGAAPDDDLDEWLDAHIDAALPAATDGRALAFLVGRSFGTMALARVVARDSWQASTVPTIWLAPLLRQSGVAVALAVAGRSAFVVGGGDDQLLDHDSLESARQAGAEVVVVEGANHGLEVDDPATSARLLADALDRLRSFVRRHAT